MISHLTAKRYQLPIESKFIKLKPDSQQTMFSYHQKNHFINKLNVPDFNATKYDKVQIFIELIEEWKVDKIFLGKYFSHYSLFATWNIERNLMDSFSKFEKTITVK